MAKKLKENAMSQGGIQAFSAPIGSHAAVLPKKRNKKTKLKKGIGTVGKLTQENILREAIRKIIFLSKMKFYQKKGQEYIAEQKLRKVVRSLLREKAEPPILPTTVDNFVRDAAGKIFTGFKKTYFSMPDKPDDRVKYSATLQKFMYNFLTNLAAQLSGKLPASKTAQPKAAAPASAETTGPVLPSDKAAPAAPEGELEEEEQLDPALAADPLAAAQKQEKDTTNSLATQTLATMKGNEGQGPGRTGAIAAYDDGPTFAGMVAPFVNKLAAEDREHFIDTFIQTIKLTGEAFEDELSDKVSQQGGAAATAPEAGTDLQPAGEEL
jgi:hypothetical protein